MPSDKVEDVSDLQYVLVVAILHFVIAALKLNEENVRLCIHNNIAGRWRLAPFLNIEATEVEDKKPGFPQAGNAQCHDYCNV